MQALRTACLLRTSTQGQVLVGWAVGTIRGVLRLPSKEHGTQPFAAARPLPDSPVVARKQDQITHPQPQRGSAIGTTSPSSK